MTERERQQNEQQLAERRRLQQAWNTSLLRGPATVPADDHRDPHGEAFYAALGRGEWMGPGR